MKKNQKAKQAASELLKRHRTLQVDLDYIVFVLETVGCDIIEFAHYLLTPTIGFCSKKWFLRHKGLLIGAGVVGILTLVFVFGVRQYQNCTYYENYYITDSGSKYHIRDCIYIEGKKALNRMTIRDYKSGAYEPCKVCIVKSK